MKAVANATEKKIAEDYSGVLKRAKLFRGLADCEMFSALACLNAKVKKCEKDAVLFREGESAEYTCIVLWGEAEIRKTDYNGNANIISRLFPSEMIGAAAAYSGKPLPFDAVCVCPTGILCLDSKSLITPCRKACAFHARIIENTLAIIAEMNARLTDKIDILTKRTTREKLLAYLYTQSKRAGGKKFAVPHARRQLADYLSVNRSAMIRELSKMRDEGLLGFDKNIFWLNPRT